MSSEQVRKSYYGFLPAGSPVWIPWTLVALLVVAVLVLGRLYSKQSDLTARLRASESVARADLDSSRTQAQADTNLLREQVAGLQRATDLNAMKVTTLASIMPDAPTARAVAIWNTELQQGLLDVKGLPANKPEQDYQVWIVDGDASESVDAGVFHVTDPAVELQVPIRCDRKIGNVARYTVSLERKGGVASAEGSMYLIGP